MNDETQPMEPVPDGGVSGPWRVDQYTFAEPGIGHGFALRQQFAAGGPKWLAYFVNSRNGETLNVWSHTDDEALAAVNRLAAEARAVRDAEVKK